MNNEQHLIELFWKAHFSFEAETVVAMVNFCKTNTQRWVTCVKAEWTSYPDALFRHNRLILNIQNSSMMSKNTVQVGTARCVLWQITFRAMLMVVFLPFPPPWDDPELLLPDLSLPSPLWADLRPSLCCWPAPRRRPSCRLSFDMSSVSNEKRSGEENLATKRTRN